MDKRRLRILGTFRRLVVSFLEHPSHEESAAARNIVSALIEFLRLLITIEASDADEVPVPSRTVVLTGQQLGVVLSYWTKEVTTTAAVVIASPVTVVDTVKDLTSEVKTEVDEVTMVKEESTVEIVTVPVSIADDDEVDAAVLKHPILELREFLEVNRSEINDPMLDKCNEIISYLEGAREGMDGAELDMKDDKDAELLPQPEGIVAQYAVRQVYTLVSAADERLKLNYWLNPPNYEMELGEVEQIPCDLTELIKICLPADTNLVADCKRILNLSVSPQSNRERTVTAPCFRTRRIEMEPIGGRMDKKIFGKGKWGFIVLFHNLI